MDDYDGVGSSFERSLERLEIGTERDRIEIVQPDAYFRVQRRRREVEAAVARQRDGPSPANRKPERDDECRCSAVGEGDLRCGEQSRQPRRGRTVRRASTGQRRDDRTQQRACTDVGGDWKLMPADHGM